MRPRLLKISSSMVVLATVTSESPLSRNSSLRCWVIEPMAPMLQKLPTARNQKWR